MARWFMRCCKFSVTLKTFTTQIETCRNNHKTIATHFTAVGSNLETSCKERNCDNAITQRLRKAGPTSAALLPPRGRRRLHRIITLPSNCFVLCRLIAFAVNSTAFRSCDAAVVMAAMDPLDVLYQKYNVLSDAGDKAGQVGGGVLLLINRRF